MTILSAKYTKVERGMRVIAEGAHPVVVQPAGKLTTIIGTTTKIESAVYERIIHRNGTIAIARRSRRQQRTHCCADANCHVLNRVMRQITRRRQREIEPAVS